MFKEFSEYTDPESMNYDIKMSLGNDTNTNNYSEQLIELIGILEEDELYLLDEYGITMEEYLNPTAETIAKVREYLENEKGKRK